VPCWIGTLTSCSRVPTPSSPALQSGRSSLLTSQAPAVVGATSCHSAVLDWHSDKLFARPTPSSPALQRGRSSLLTSQAPAVVGATSCHSAVLDWHSDKLFARSDSFVACVAAWTLIVADFASSCSRRSDQLS
jgi:hypothetical protein